MNKEQLKWNKRYSNHQYPTQASELVKNNYHLASRGKALDIAAGMGRNSLFLSSKGFRVDAVDISSVAMEKLKLKDIRINATCCDLDFYTPVVESYNLIINFHFLNRRLLPLIQEALKPGGILIFQTFLESDDPSISQPSNKSFILRKNELRVAFASMEQLYYQESVKSWFAGKYRFVASMVARKP